ncbi:MAG: S53 family peptidase [Actinobacteria bacterium]|nr:S53 family peptidase [Actinomycetota bacterium]MCA1719683.1 S53 family peptidase [Actinomycetota bacterium]
MSARRRPRPTPLLALAALVLGLGLSGGGVGARSATAATPTSVAVVQTRVSGGVSHPLRLKVFGTRPDATALLTSTTATGYTPAQVRGYLGLSGTGAGQTVAVISAYDAPNIVNDLATFNQKFGLPAPPSFKKVNQTGGTKFPTVDGGWALETALDVEWVHAVAPGAAIILVEASSSALSNLLTALTYASKLAGVTVLSNSYGTAEYSTQGQQDYRCKLTTGVCVFATGDNGNPGLYPATSPWALAVGGTSLGLDGAGAVTSEVAWSGSGGGVSLYTAKPSFQSGLSAPRRAIPDVSYDGDPATGFPTFSSTTYQNQSGWFQMGGTSAGAPQWSGVLAVSNQLRKAAGKGPLVAANSAGGAPLHAALYPSGTLADIVSGSNGSCGAVCTAGPGYDTVTGLGSPRAGLDLVLKGLA